MVPSYLAGFSAIALLFTVFPEWPITTMVSSVGTSTIGSVQCFVKLSSSPRATSANEWVLANDPRSVHVAAVAWFFP
jgi:hypothetical protein